MQRALTNRSKQRFSANQKQTEDAFSALVVPGQEAAYFCFESWLVYRVTYRHILHVLRYRTTAGHLQILTQRNYFLALHDLSQAINISSITLTWKLWKFLGEYQNYLRVLADGCGASAGTCVGLLKQFKNLAIYRCNYPSTKVESYQATNRLKCPQYIIR